MQSKEIYELEIRLGLLVRDTDDQGSWPKEKALEVANTLVCNQRRGIAGTLSFMIERPYALASSWAFKSLLNPMASVRTLELAAAMKPNAVNRMLLLIAAAQNKSVGYKDILHFFGPGGDLEIERSELDSYPFELSPDQMYEEESFLLIAAYATSSAKLKAQIKEILTQASHKLLGRILQMDDYREFLRRNRFVPTYAQMADRVVREFVLEDIRSLTQGTPLSLLAAYFYGGPAELRETMKKIFVRGVEGVRDFRRAQVVELLDNVIRQGTLINRHPDQRMIHTVLEFVDEPETWYV